MLSEWEKIKNLYSANRAECTWSTLILTKQSRTASRYLNCNKHQVYYPTLNEVEWISIRILFLFFISFLLFSFLSSSLMLLSVSFTSFCPFQTVISVSMFVSLSPHVFICPVVFIVYVVSFLNSRSFSCHPPVNCHFRKLFFFFPFFSSGIRYTCRNCILPWSLINFPLFFLLILYFHLWHCLNGFYLQFVLNI